MSLIYFSSYISFFWKALYNSESFLRVKLHSYPFQFSTFSSSNLFLGSHRSENWKQLCYLEGIHFLLYFSCVKVHLLIFQCRPQFKSIPFSSLATTTPDNTLFLFHLFTYCFLVLSVSSPGFCAAAITDMLARVKVIMMPVQFNIAPK